jgi:translation initiation factor 3 subunit F
VDVLLSAPLSSKSIAPQNPLAQFKTALGRVSATLDTVLAHVEAVIAGQAKGDPKLAAHLLETLSNVVMPTLNQDGDGTDMEDFEAHLAVRRLSCSLVKVSFAAQDLLMVSYLSNLARYQLELAGRLALLPDKGGMA